MNTIKTINLLPATLLVCLTALVIFMLRETPNAWYYVFWIVIVLGSAWLAERKR